LGKVINKDGKITIDVANAAIKTDSVSGLKNGEFSPLGENADKTLVAKFQNNYRKYKREKINPLFQTLLGCDGLIVLIDIAEILMQGVHLYNDCSNLLNNIFKILSPTDSIIRGILKTVGVSSLRKVALVANQCDRFHENDWDCLKHIVTSFSDAMTRKYPQANNKAFVCSSVVSTTRGRGDSRLISKETNQEYEVYSIIDSKTFAYGMPDSWDAKNIKIPMVKPYIPKRINAVPEHSHLNEIFCYITGWFN
jgi:hypothetical protein